MKEMIAYFNEKFGIQKAEIEEAVYKADEFRLHFEKGWLTMGREVMSNIP